MDNNFWNQEFKPYVAQEDDKEEAVQPSSTSMEPPVAQTKDFWQQEFKPYTEQATPDMPQEEEEYGFDLGAKFSKNDLKQQPELTQRIRDYMIKRNGVRYNVDGPINNDELVEDFVDHMRNFNTNLVSTAGEVRFISKADEDTKALAAEAYKIYDNLGNVFVNDGFYGAVDGIKDYVFAAASDPSNYLGILTGGAAKAGAFAGGAAGRQLVRKAAAEAGMAALKKGATRQAAEKAGQEAADRALARFVASGVNTEASKKAITRAAELEKNIFLSQAKRRASKEVLDEAAKKQGRKALMATTAGDALIAMGHDYQIQSLMMEVGVQEEYSALQTGFSSLLGAVGGGAQLAFGKGLGASGLGDAAITVAAGAKRAEVQEDIGKIIAKEATKKKPILDEEGMKKAAQEITFRVREWREKWQRGQAAHLNDTTAADLLSRIVLGPNGKGNKGGLVKVFNDAGMKLEKGVTVSDALTNVVEFLPRKEMEEINNMLKGVGVSIGDLTQSTVKLSDFVAYASHNAGKTLNVFSVAKRMIDTSIIQGADVLDTAAANVLLREGDKEPSMALASYTQNLWKRMLVSSPATTAVNVAGFGQYYIGSTLADVLSGGAMTIAGLASTGAKRAEFLRVGKVYRQMVAQKMRYLVDPYTTHDAYMRFIQENPKLNKILLETFSGGVERNAERFGIKPDAKWYVNAEKIADGANRWTGVKIQDSFTKSQMFIAEMDKYLRINKGKTLQEVVNGGDTALIDDDVLGAALDTTMKSVFSKDYTVKGELLAETARFVESVSNVPVLGTILPFGRFMNNVVATGYQWFAGGAIEAMQAIAKSEKRNLSTMEAFSRTLVAYTGLGLAMHYDEEKQAKGLTATQVEIGGGQVADVKNLYPASLWMVAGRIANLHRKGETIPAELGQELLNQMAIGQVAKDAQFGNDLNNLLALFTSGDQDQRSVSMDVLYKQTGNIAAGFTRPLDAINRAAGFIFDSDVAKDVRQGRGSQIFTQAATKYVDNIIEAFTGDIDAITGKELRVATREGQIQDANPAARIAGVTINPPQNHTEFVYALSEMLPYTANMRTKNPAYDKLYNTLLAPELERVAKNLMQSKTFMEGSVAVRRGMLSGRLSAVKETVTKYMKEYGTDEQMIETLRKSALSQGSKEARQAARKYINQRGVQADIRDMGYFELKEYMEYVDAWDKYYKGK